MKKRRKMIGYVAAGIVGCIAILVFVCNQIICNAAEGKLYSDVNDVPQSTEVGLLLGSPPQTRIGRMRNFFFKYRIDAAAELYKAGKVHTILISGDEHSLDGVNEVVAMRDSLMAKGVPQCAMVLDGKGFRTLDSVVRATKVYGVKRYIVISQKFHNERAIYLAKHLGLDVDADELIGYNAKDSHTNLAITTYIREYFARVKVFLDLITGKQPRTLEK